MSSTSATPDRDAIVARNISAFLWFRVLFNSRLYYPVFTILFLDFGLSVEQFAALNAAWAATIVVCEVPSGALADKLGRRRLVVFSGWLMLLEMTILCFMPAGGPWLFPLFLANRIISGMAEAACSGADEAMVYDALPVEGRDQAWTRVLASLMRWQSLTFMIVALTGAAVYSADFMNRAADFLGFDVTFSREFCMRLPLILNWLMAVATIAVSFLFIDTHERFPNTAGAAALLRASTRQMIDTGRWILRTPAAVVLILTGLLYDAFMRLFYSIGSNYYRLLGIDEAWNGVILASSSLLGIGTAIVVEKLVGALRPSQNMGFVALLILAGLTGISLTVRGWAGVLFVVPFWLGMRSLHYFLSQYLNRVSGSANRATVLSFKGLTMNLSYGAIMLFFQAQTFGLRVSEKERLEGLDKQSADLRLLELAMPWWPWIFGALALGLALFVRWRYKAGLTELILRE